MRRLLGIAGVLSVTAIMAVATSHADARGFAFGFNEHYGWQTDGATPGEKLVLTKKAGGKIARTPLDWRCVEPTQGEWSELCWQRLGEFYDGARQRGIRPLFNIVGSPKWARAHRCNTRIGPNCSMPPAREHNPAWRKLAAEAARRFPRAIFEIWNEPNLAAYWNGRPQPARYAQLVRLAYRAVKRVSPRARVLAGAVVGTNETKRSVMGSRLFLRRAFKAPYKMKRSLDGISYHVYNLAPGLGRNTHFGQTLRRMRSVTRHHLPPKRRNLWLTETGVSTGYPELLSKREQARRLWRTYRKLKRINMMRAVVFHRLIEPRETRGDSAWELGLAWMRYRPITRYPRKIKPRPVFCLFSKRLGKPYPPCR